MKQDFNSLYRKFRCGTVYVTDGIRLSMHITQNGRDIEGALSQANFHFEDKEGSLRSYLPKNEVDREVCFESDLPRRLCEFLSITDPGAPGIIGAVFRQKNSAVIDRILEKEGVGQVDCDFAAIDEELGASETLAKPTSDIRLQTPSPTRRLQTPSGWERRREQRSGSANAQTIPDLRTPSRSHHEARTDPLDKAYSDILKNVVDTARQRGGVGVLETTGSPIAKAMKPTATEPLPQQTIRDAFPARTQERDFKLGAAGELFIFESLKRLQLKDFSILNWTSAIRDRVNAHPDYRGLEKSNDRVAIADIEYLDSTSEFTEFLIEEGHLDREIWNDKRPFYHLEVKTTTSADWREPFFMSKAQEKHVSLTYCLSLINCLQAVRFSSISLRKVPAVSMYI